MKKLTMADAVARLRAEKNAARDKAAKYLEGLPGADSMSAEEAYRALAATTREVSANLIRQWLNEQRGTATETVAPKRGSTLIRPGLLVSLKTSLRGGINYRKETIDASQQGDASVVTWQTTRTIADAAEHERAVIARGKARAAVTRVCCASTFGLLCPESQESELDAAIQAAQAIAAEHNATAACTRLEVYAITGRVADSDVQAAKAIGSEVKELLAAMEAAVRAADPKAIREAANKARAVAVMLSRDTQVRVQAAIGEARGIARKIVTTLEETGTVAAIEFEQMRLTAIRDARFTVLDSLGEDTYLPPETVAPLPARGIDMAPGYDLQEVTPAVARNLDLGE